MKKKNIKSYDLKDKRKNSLKKTNRKLVILCKKNRVKKYKKLFKNKGNKKYIVKKNR